MIIKTLVSALIISLASELSKRSVFLAALLISLPLTSLLSLYFAYREGASAEKLSALSMGIFWFVIPSLVFFPLFSLLLQRKVSLFGATAVSLLVTIVTYHLWMAFLRFLGISLS